MADNQSAEGADASMSASTAPAISFESITFSDGTVVDIDPHDIVVVVGPNNAGKSVALRELEKCIGPAIRQTVIHAVSLRRSGSADQLRVLLDRHARLTGTAGNRIYRGYRFAVSDQNLAGLWESGFQNLRPLFCMSIATETRITDSNPVSAIPILDQPPSHPIHMLYIDDRVEERISAYFRRAFGEDLIVFRVGGGQWPLLVGKRPKVLSEEHPYSASYNERLLASTVPLQAQGDGMRSYASVVLHMLAPRTQSVLLLDEPEAFLHPSQARLLGEFIARERPAHAQLFVATHSADVLQGFLNVAPEQLRVLHIQRDGAVNRVKELDKERAMAISTDPLMKFSSVMSGVFHERVIICEADADCMFYASILDLPTVHGEQQPDVLFVQAGGKHRLAALAEALRALDVTVDVVADMDVVKDEEILERIVIALGGSWSAIQSQVRPIKAAIEQRKLSLNSGEIVKEVREALSKAPSTGEFPKNLRAEIGSIFKKASPWEAVKHAGAAAIPSGQPSTHFQELQRLCSDFGLWIVPVGELEGFCKSVGGHGPRWVQQVMETHDLARDDELANARDFVREVWTRRKLTTQHPAGC